MAFERRLKGGFLFSPVMGCLDIVVCGGSVCLRFLFGDVVVVTVPRLAIKEWGYLVTCSKAIAKLEDTLLFCAIYDVQKSRPSAFLRAEGRLGLYTYVEGVTSAWRVRRRCA